MRVFALLLAATAACGQEMIGMRSVGADEAARYHAIEAEIGCAFENVHRVDDAIVASREMLEPLGDGELSSQLKFTLSDAAFAAVDDPDALAYALLDERDREIAFDYVLNHGDWLRDPRLRSRLAELFVSDGTPDDERTTIAWMFENAHALDDVRQAAMNLACDHSRPLLAHRVAEAIAAERDDDDAALRALFSSPSRAVREEAWRLAYRCGDDVVLWRERQSLPRPQPRARHPRSGEDEPRAAAPTAEGDRLPPHRPARVRRLGPRQRPREHREVFFGPVDR